MHVSFACEMSPLEFSSNLEVIPSVGDVVRFDHDLPDGDADYWEFRVKERVYFYDAYKDLEDGGLIHTECRFISITLEPFGDTLEQMTKALADV